MAVSTFDTLNAMRGLEAAGIDPKQAEANAVRDAVMEGTATKGDILRVDNDVNTGFASLDGKIDALAKDTKADIARLETRMLMAMIVVAGIIVAAVKYL